MGIEIERKFLVRNDAWKDRAGEGLPCRQGYLLSDGERTLRVRIIGSRAYLTVKGPTEGCTRMEFEYEIPADDAEILLSLCASEIEKVRYHIQDNGNRWDLDVFGGANRGLILAEIELRSEEQPFSLPDWIGEEVTGDPRYHNACLARNPFSGWEQRAQG